MESFKENLFLETFYEMFLKAQRDSAGIYNTEYLIGIPIQSCGPYWTQQHNRSGNLVSGHFKVGELRSLRQKGQ
jgi:hypothetical protein